MLAPAKVLANLLQLVLGLAKALAEYAQTNRLMDAGASEAMLKGIRDADAAIARANTARANVDSLPIESDPQNRSRRK